MLRGWWHLIHTRSSPLPTEPIKIFLKHDLLFYWSFNARVLISVEFGLFELRFKFLLHELWANWWILRISVRRIICSEQDKTKIAGGNHILYYECSRLELVNQWTNHHACDTRVEVEKCCFDACSSSKDFTRFVLRVFVPLHYYS
jgi:hypothetical protein